MAVEVADPSLLLSLTVLVVPYRKSIPLTRIARYCAGYFVSGDDYGDYILHLNDAGGTGPCGRLSQKFSATYSVLTNTTTYTLFLSELPNDPNPVAGGGCDINPGLSTLDRANKRLQERSRVCR
ncbi:hypothetical protein [Terriglobus aquaticus]|uniref:Uncharacterized protein n=1 Tax=Terriglobus aquaticus TaxID=940139 RepID=A0ABW9KM67_9BACT|nr:hypothetical protein [Terriglobus aquaticus]